MNVPKLTPPKAYLPDHVVQLCIWRDMLKIHGNYSTCLDIRKKLHEHAVNTYKPRYAAMHMRFMNDHAPVLSINGVQSTNHPYYFTLFTVVSQHVMGDCVEECLDKAIEIMLSKASKV